MQNTKWYLSKTHLVLVDGPHYNAVKIEGGKAKECDMPATKHRHIAERRVQTLNNHEVLAQVAMKVSK